MFFISMLRMYIANPTHIIHHEPVEWTPDLSYEEKPIKIIDRQTRKLRSKEIIMVKVLWHNHSIEDVTWEVELDMLKNHPELFGK